MGMKVARSLGTVMRLMLGRRERVFESRFEIRSRPSVGHTVRFVWQVMVDGDV
jgi:hypothetical protein